jgi:[ribosomal protein S5]-alanine N-acetyltransferase
MELVVPRGRIRSWRPDDAPSMARHANSRRIWLNVRDHFPHPYTLADATEWVARAASMEPETQFAIEIDGEAAGGIGLFLQQDVTRYSAELGYWLGEAHWGRGVMTGAVRGFTEYAFGAFELCRIFAVVFEWNSASRRVLEKAGYELEGRMRRAAVKDGQVIDQFLYATVRDFDPEPPVGGAPQQSG